MNTVTVATAVEPHLVTTVTNNTSMRGVVGNQVHPIISNGYSAVVPTLVTNGIIDGGRTNPAGPQLEEEDKMDRGMIGGEDNCMNLLNSSPDEHEPLLQREQPPAESTPTPHHHQSRPGNIPSGQASNSNNNNNRIALGSDVKFQGLEVDPERMIGSEVSWGGGINSAKPEPQQISGSPTSDPVSNLENKILLSNPAKGATSGRVQILQAPPTGQDRGPGLNTGPCARRALVALPVLAPQSTRSPKAHLVQSTATTLVPGCRDPDSGSASSSTTPASQAQEPATETSTSSSTALDAQTLTPEVQGLKASDPETSVLGASVENQKVSPLVASENPAPENPALESQDPEIAVLTEAPASEPAALQSPALVPQTPSLLRPQMAKAKRPERPCSLDLSSSCISSGEPRLNV